MGTFVKRSFGLLFIVATGTVSYAQALIAGVARDTSGAVLPGVTVEASSPALIEKTRVVVTDAHGHYQIFDLRPGAYIVLFTLANFASVKREDVVLTGSFAAAVNAELSVGGIQEAVTVTGAMTSVDVQSTTKQWVLGHDVIDTFPTGKTDRNLAVLIPGIMATRHLQIGHWPLFCGGVLLSLLAAGECPRRYRRGQMTTRRWSGT